jgi:hypothetical protein
VSAVVTERNYAYNRASANIYLDEEALNVKGKLDISDCVIALSTSESTDIERDEIITSYENSGSELISVKGQFSAMLKPGRRIVVSEVGIENRTSQLVAVDRELAITSSVFNNSKIDTDYIPTGESISTSDKSYRKLLEWMRFSQIEVEELTQRIKEKDLLLLEKDGEIHAYKNELKGIVYANKVKELAMKSRIMIIPRIHFNLLFFSAIAFSISVISIAYNEVYGRVLIPNEVATFFILLSFAWGGTVLLMRKSWGWREKHE